jgi:hypothetical protein
MTVVPPLRVALAVAALATCSLALFECFSGDATGGASDAGADAALPCFICPEPDASLGARVEARFASCNGIETCHVDNAAGLHFPPGQEFSAVVNVRSTENPALMRVLPGDPLASYLYLKVRGDGGYDGARMPKDAPFNPLIPERIFEWIEAGCPDP